MSSHDSHSQASFQRAGALGTAADFFELTKPRIGAFVIYAAFAGGLLSAGPEANLWRVTLAALLIGCVAASSCVFNQILERDLDRLMQRTAARPLVAGRLSVRDATFFGAALALVGTVGLAVEFNLLAALLGLSTFTAYVLVYTPLKRYSSFNTVIGAIPGAMPPLLGSVALAGEPQAWGWLLFAVVFAWQFPHFLAIAWLHRADYARAGMRMLPALEGGAAMAGRQAFIYSLLLLPVSLLPGARGEGGIVFTGTVLLAGLVYAAASAAFAWKPTVKSARRVLFTSLVYLPIVFTVALVDPVVSLTLRSLTP